MSQSVGGTAIENTASSQPPSILMIDDDTRHLRSLKQLLEAKDYTCDTASSGVDGLALIQKNHYDLLLLDMRMPGMSGQEVLKTLKERSIHLNTVVVSGETSFEDTTEALRNGATDYLKKPYVPAELLARVERALEKKSLEEANQLMQLRINRSEKLHRYIVNNSPDIIFVLDSLGNIIFINAKVESLLHYSRSDLHKKNISMIVDDEDEEKAKYFFDTKSNPIESHRSIELSLKTKDHGNKKQRHFEISIWPLLTEEETQDETASLQIYGSARDITERIEAEEFISFQAYHDLLTRLPNRSLFKDRLSVAITQAQRSEGKLAVMFIDLDRFKVVNDSLGHTMGDRLLQAVAQRLLSCTRKGDTLSRFGGDEFTMLLPDIQGGEAAGLIAQKILNEIKKPFVLSGNEIFIGASIGIAVFPESGDEMDLLIKHADIAMYNVKNTGKDGYKIFADSMHTSTEERMQLEQDLHHSIENNEIAVYYQPQINIENNSIIGVEALIRWNHPELGQLSPAKFIGIAEDSRLIIALDQSTLRKACMDVAAIHELNQKIRLSVNLSPLIFEQKNLVETVTSVLEETQFPAEYLELEITENILVSDRQDILEKLHVLSDMGIRFAIDDFGTGYSSLSYLQKLPISTLKIDRSFIDALSQEHQETGIVDAIISMASSLGMEIIAEGVENEIQLNYLQKLQCKVVQGYLYSEPATLTALKSLINSFNCSK